MALLSFACLAQALDPNRTLVQYHSDRWGADQGFPGGAVYAIAQTEDGYLWIGSEAGLVRFDGLSFQLLTHASSTSDPIGPVRGLEADAEGNLWLRTEQPRLLRYRDGIFQDALPGHEKAENAITAMCRDSHGKAIFSGHANEVLRYSQGKFSSLVSKAEPSRKLVLSMTATADGRVWLGTREAGVISLFDGRVAKPGWQLQDRKINCLLPVSDRELWIGTDHGIRRRTGTAPDSPVAPAALSGIQVLAMLKDRESNIWVGTANGLYRINSRGVLSPLNTDSAVRSAVTALYEDREGNLWLGGPEGIQRFRDNAFLTYALSSGVPANTYGSLYVDHERRTWFAPAEGGLYWLQDGRAQRVTSAGRNTTEVIYSIDGRGSEVWLGMQQRGLIRLRHNGGSLTAKTYTRADGLAQNSVYAVHVSPDGTVWAGTLTAGVSHLENGAFTTYTTADGLASNTISAIDEAADGTMFFATPNGLNTFQQGRWHVYTSTEGLPPGAVNCLFEDSRQVLWIGTAKGLAFLRSGRIQIPREMPESLNGEIFGITEDNHGYVWIAASGHLLRVKRDALLGEAAQLDAHEFGRADGLPTIEPARRYRSVTSDPLGRIWFSTSRGLSVVDPARLASAAVRALVHIESVSADGRPVDIRNSPLISASHQRLTFGFKGIVLSAPERVRFRYMLDPLDHDWSEPLATREAVYGNLSPGHYNFRVMASNANGLWNSRQASFAFEIKPAFWQTWPFRLSCVAAVLLIFAIFFRYRIRRLTTQLNLRFEERLAERTRIAQELHDTLLQGFFSASMQVHVAAERVPIESPAKLALNRALDLMVQVIDEGRSAVRGLRSERDSSSSLEQAFSRLPLETGMSEKVDFGVIVEGQSRPLHPIVRHEVYRIGREALVNALRHSRAKKVEVELEYAPHHLRLLVRDNGCGIDPAVLESGRAGHWGLLGMRERAERIGVKLNLWTHLSAGTEVGLSVPGRIAFLPDSSPRLRKRLSKKRKPLVDVVAERKQ